MPLPGLPPGTAPPPDQRLWTLVRGKHTATCWQRAHPMGLQLRLDVDQDTMRTAVARTAEEAQEASAHMREAMKAKGWVDLA